MEFIIAKDKTTKNPTHHETFILIPSSWNDYGYRTQYSLYHIDTRSKKTNTFIGMVKILRKDMTDDNNFPVNENFHQLNADYISLGQSLDYYKRISELPAQIQHEVLKRLNDVAQSPALTHQFREHPGWTLSLIREIANSKDFLSMASSIIHDSYNNLIDENLEFTFKYEDWDESVQFDFSPNQQNPELSKYLPNRLIALIGTNGSGKSTLLSRIARVAYATEKDRESPELKNLGTILPHSIGFPRIITISYSPFDSFKIPLISYNSDIYKHNEKEAGYVDSDYVNTGYVERANERKQVIEDMTNGNGRFIFCGLRDIAKEASILEEQTTKISECDRVLTTTPKPIEQLKTELILNFNRIVEQKREHILDKALLQFNGDVSLSSYSYSLNSESLKRIDLNELFMEWSTGHKIVMQIIFSLVAHTTQSSLVLIDEPETHLHPPLLAVLMHSIRVILKETKSFAIVATHSPVVLQETLSNNTYIIERNDSSTKIRKPNIETFGENIGTLTSQVFGLNSETTNFYKTLNKLVEKEQDILKLDALFSGKGLSTQARAYISNRISKINK